MLKGIFPPIPTPFIDGEIAFDKLKFNLEKWNQTGITGYVVSGSNGESAYLTNEEKIELFSFVKKNSSENFVMIAGTGSDSIKETVWLTNKAAESGADYALVLTPSYYKDAMNHDAFINFFSEVADKVRIPLIIYNVPKFSGINILSSTVNYLSRHPNIAGIKDTTTDVAHMHEIITGCDKEFTVLAGTASVLYPALAVGAKGAILAAANVVPELCMELYKSYLECNYSGAVALQEKLIEINKAVTTQFGIPGLKTSLDLIGYYGGPVRKPLQDLPESNIKIIKDILIKLDKIK